MGLENISGQPTIDWKKLHREHLNLLLLGIQMEVGTQPYDVARRFDQVIASEVDELGLNRYMEELILSQREIHEPRSIHYGRFSFDRVNFTVSTPYFPDQEVQLTPVEGIIFNLLLTNAPRIVPYGILSQAALPGRTVNNSKTIRTHTTHIRQKIEIVDSIRESHIQNIVTVGFKFVDPILSKR